MRTLTRSVQAGGRLVAGTILGIAACSDAPVGFRNSTEVRVRDSAGVEIVDAPQPFSKALPHWISAPEPELTLGVVEGPEEYQFAGIGAVRTLSDGRIVVANESPIALRYYSADGTFLSSVGREGEGPGEFRRLSDVWVTIPRRLDPIDSNRQSIPEFGSDYILVVERDEMDVELVRRYPLVDADTGERVGR
jgi:hypothetical protein